MEAPHPSAGRRPARRAGVKIGAIVLAAGSSSRLGQSKQLLVYRGQSLVRRSAQAALNAGCAPVVIVLGAESDRIADELRDLPVTILINENWARGQGNSLRAGVRAAEDCDALVILLCDQPQTDAALLRRLIDTHLSSGQPMVASAYAGTLGVPALFACSCFKQLLSLGDDAGAKALLRTRPGEVASVAFPEGALDVDMPEDLRSLGD